MGACRPSGRHAPFAVPFPGMDPLEFLLAFEPFSRLSPARREALGRSLEISYSPAGSQIITRGGERSGTLWVVRKGAVRLEADGRPVDVLSEGEVFGFPSLLSGGPPQFDVIALEDSLFYRIPEPVFHELLEEPGFGEFFYQSLARRLRGALEREPAIAAADLSTPIERLATRAPVAVDAGRTVGEVARIMRDERVSSVLVRGMPMGIVTDSDLRTRVLAEGRGPDTPVSKVMSAPLKTFPADAPVFEALLHVLEQRIHHLALIRNGSVIGVVTHADILRHQVKSPAALLKRVDRATDPADWAGYADEVAGTVESLLWGGLEPADIGHVVASLNDSLVQNVLRWAEVKSGPPPCPYAWIVHGSEGRREQALITDQDNALVFAEDTSEARDYFRRFAEVVIEALTKASFPPCPGGFMATKWNYTLDEWDELFRGWTTSPEPEALMEVANFFDFRSIHGRLDLERLHARIAEGGSSSVFLAHLTRAGLGMRPPIGLFHRIKEEDEGIDLKAGGIVPTVSLARVYALEARSRARSTLDRLEAARRAGVVSETGAETLAEGFRFLFRLRLESQMSARRKREEPTNRVRLDDLSPLERRHLKETFLHIREMQESVSQRYKVGLLG